MGGQKPSHALQIFWHRSHRRTSGRAVSTRREPAEDAVRPDAGECVDEMELGDESFRQYQFQPAQPASLMKLASLVVISLSVLSVTYANTTDLGSTAAGAYSKWTRGLAPVLNSPTLAGGSSVKPENRDIPVATDGVFHDAFAPWAAHFYEIDMK